MKHVLRNSPPCNGRYHCCPMFLFKSYFCLSNAKRRHNINLPECARARARVSVCPSHFLSTRLQVRPLNGFYS